MSEENEVLDQDSHVEAPENLSVESEARMQGWVPLEEFRGSNDDWIDADTFVKRGKEINPILKKNNERLLRELESTKRQMSELKSVTEEFKKFQKEQYERKASELETEIRILRERKKEAISSGDGELSVQIDDRIDELREERNAVREEANKPEPQKQQEIIPEVEEWVSNNQWYAKDQRMASITNGIAEDIRKVKPWLVGRAFFDELDSALAETFAPEKIGRKQQVRSPVERNAPGSGPVGKGNKYEALPPDAKAACDSFVKQGLMTKDEYLKMYFE